MFDLIIMYFLINRGIFIIALYILVWVHDSVLYITVSSELSFSWGINLPDRTNPSTAS
jgi:hypothetical protein